jgi:hypothetical protein
MLGQVDRIPIGIINPVFRLPVGWSFFDLGRCAPLSADGHHGIDALHFETEMVDTLLEMIAFYFPFGSYGDDR